MQRLRQGIARRLSLTCSSDRGTCICRADRCSGFPNAHSCPMPPPHPGRPLPLRPCTAHLAQPETLWQVCRQFPPRPLSRPSHLPATSRPPRFLHQPPDERPPRCFLQKTRERRKEGRKEGKEGSDEGRIAHWNKICSRIQKLIGLEKNNLRKERGRRPEREGNSQM